jgi:hypothetical protein
MNISALDVQSLRRNWRDIKIKSRNDVKSILIFKYGNLTKAAHYLNIPYIRLSATIAGRENIHHVIAAIQRDLELTDTQVLHLWPLLKQWPK